MFIDSLGLSHHAHWSPSLPSPFMSSLPFVISLPPSLPEKRENNFFNSNLCYLCTHWSLLKISVFSFKSNWALLHLQPCQKASIVKHYTSASPHRFLRALFSRLLSRLLFLVGEGRETEKKKEEKRKEEVKRWSQKPSMPLFLSQLCIFSYSSRSLDHVPPHSSCQQHTDYELTFCFTRTTDTDKALRGNPKHKQHHSLQL